MGKHFTTWLPPLQSWLQDSITSAQLSAAGLSPGPLLQMLHDTLVAAKRLRGQGSRGDTGVPGTDVHQQHDQSSTSAGADGTDATALPRRLHALGVLLSSLPTSWGCNNPLCNNMQGPAEAGVVQGKGHKCKGCSTAHYCGKECQAHHWKQHKPVCKAIAAAANDAAVKL